MKYLINYADGGFYESRAFNSISGIQAGFDAVIQYRRKDISEDFLKANERILNEKRGAGYWLWKPYFIWKTLRDTDEGDIIFYSDSGAKFIRHLHQIFEKIRHADRGILAFEMSGHHKENEYCRKQVAEEVVCCEEEIIKSDQRMASFIGVRNCEESFNVIDQWERLCTKEHLILDLPPQEGEFETFKEHRHDQALWSLLSKKLKLETAPDPSQWGITHKQTSKEDYFIHHHREKK